MGVWVVSLSTHELSPASLTLRLMLSSIWSLIDSDSLRHQEPFRALPLESKIKGYTKIYFGENQLSPGSFDILPLTTGHLSPLLRTRVRASSHLSVTFTLPMVSSPGFGSFLLRLKLSQLGIAFTPPPS